RLDPGEHPFLGEERELDVELVELARRSIGSCILLAEARRDLEITVEAGHHQQRFELLRRLWQRVELALVDAAWHEIVAGAFGRTRGENRRLELEETLLLHAPADARDHPGPQHDVGVNLLAAQVEKAISETLVFRNLLRPRHL